MNKSFSAHIVVEEGELQVPIKNYISKLDKVENGLEEDDFGNLRYVGSSPNNYITFNNETWRIIGIVDGYLKIIRDGYIGSYYWNSNGTNNWETSTLQEYLNETYYKSLTEKAQSQIAKVTWYLGGWNTASISEAQMYKYERGIGSTGTIGEEYHVYTGNPTTWIGNIALMYPSDWGYASDDLNCYSLSDPNCSNNNWLFISNQAIEWLLTPKSSVVDNAFNLSPIQITNQFTVSHSTLSVFRDSYSVRPALHLTNETTRISGTGTSLDPYIIE